MKKTISLLVSLLLLLSSLFGLVPAAQADGDHIEITGYSVSGVLGVSNVYAIRLNLKSTAPVPGDDGPAYKLSSLEVVATGSGFKPVVSSGSGYTITLEPVKASNSTISSLNSSSSNHAASYTVYFLKSGSTDDLNLGFRYEYSRTIIPDEGDPFEDKHSGTTGGQSIAVIKTAPDPIVPEWPNDPPVDTTRYKPLIGVDNEADMPVLNDETKVLTIPVRNSASYSASKINIELEPADKTKPVFTANRMSVSTYISSLTSNGKKDAKFNVQLAPSATAGIHPVILNYTYQNSYGDNFTNTETAYIRVETANTSPRLFASAREDATLTPGSEAKVSFTIENSGNNPARNVKVSLLGLSPSGVSVMRDVDIRYLERIEGMGEQTVDFNLYAAPTLSDSVTMLQVKLDYADFGGVSYSETNTIFLPLTTGGGEGGVPRLIISRYSMQPEEIKAGSIFLLNLYLRNTSQSKAITNLKVTILSDDGIFLPVDASNTIFIDRIEPSATVTARLPLATKADAENKPYSLRITFDYESNQGQSYSSQEVISIAVRQNPRLVVGEPMFYGEPIAYQMLPVTVEFYNLGKTILYNLMVRAEGPFQVEGGSYFVGNFNPGMSDSFNVAITPTEPGALSGAVVFAFEDSVGTAHEVRREFSLNVMEPFVPEDPGFKPPPPPKKTNWWLYGGLGAAALAALGGGIFFFRRRRKLKLQMQDSENFVAATSIVVPEIEYVGFDDAPKPTDPGAKQ